MTKFFQRAFEVKYLGPTNCLGARVRIKDTWNNKTKIISFDYSHNGAWETAVEYLESLGIEIVARAGTIKIDWLMSDNFLIDLS